MPSSRYTHSTPSTASTVTVRVARSVRTTPARIAGGARATSRAFAIRVDVASTLPAAASATLRTARSNTAATAAR